MGGKKEKEGSGETKRKGGKGKGRLEKEERGGHSSPGMWS